jgi:hypothetical protein
MIFLIFSKEVASASLIALFHYLFTTLKFNNLVLCQELPSLVFLAFFRWSHVGAAIRQECIVSFPCVVGQLEGTTAFLKL